MKRSAHPEGRGHPSTGSTSRADKKRRDRSPTRNLGDLTPDPHNANRGTDRGRAALERSLREFGPGRAVLVDRHGCIIAGNKTVEQAKRLNIPLRVVKTDGHHLIAVQRDDLDLVTDPRAKALAIADNRVGELDLEWNIDMLKQLHAEGLDLSAFGSDAEFATLFADPTRGLTDENAVVEPGPTDIVRGDLFVLGRHRLLGGDATSAGDVTRLLDGATPALMATDLRTASRTTPPGGAEENPTWGYTRIRGTLKNVGHRVGRSTIARIQKAHGLPPVPERPTSRQTFRRRAHWGAIAGVDFFTTEVSTWRGLVTHYTVFVIDLPRVACRSWG
jgi:hypothetical protein